jgi:hypothetical protein
MENKEWAKLQEALLSEQLKVIRHFLKEKNEQADDQSIKKRSKSNISIIKDILKASGRPLHVSEIIRRAKEDHQITMDRESIVSALTKKVRRGETFIRVAPNTFGLKEKE